MCWTGGNEFFELEKAEGFGVFGGNGLLGQRLQPEIALRVVAQERYVEIVTRVMERIDGVWMRYRADREELG